MVVKGTLTFLSQTDTLALKVIIVDEERDREMSPMSAMPNMAGMMKQIQKMQEKMAQLQLEL